MDTLELYQGLKTGKIKKSQLSEQQIGDVYKYMVDSKKVSVNQIKPETVKKFNLDSNTNTAVPKTSETYSPFKIKTNFNTPNYEQPKIKPITQQTKSTNPENELVDLLSNLSMNRGKTIKNERSQVGPTSQYLPKIDASKQGEWGTNPVKSAATNLWAGFGDLGRGVANVVDMTLGDKNIPFVDNYLNAIKKDTSKEDARLAEINQGNVGEFAGQVFRGIGQSIPSVGIGLAGAPIAATNPLLASNGTQLISNAAQLSNPTLALTTQQALTDVVKNPNLIPSMIQSVGNQYYQAIKDGATKEQAIKSSLLGGIPSGLIEVMGGTENLAKKLASKMSIGKLTIESGLGEAFEEIMQYPLENLGQKVAYDSSMPYFSTTENAVINPGQQGYNAATAFVSSALMGGVGGAINNGINKISNNNQPQNYNQQITNLQTGIDEDLKTLYNGLENKNIKGDNLDKSIEATKQMLEVTKRAYPELTDFFDGHINKLNEYKTQVINKVQANENNNGEQLVNGDVKIAQNANNDVIKEIEENQIQPIENVSNIETRQIEDVPQMENQVVSEPINQDSTMQEIAQEKIIGNKQEEIQPIDENDNMNNYAEDSEKNILTKEQQETFKDSKVRNKDGNLLTVYHGTDAKFDTFTPNYAPGWGTGIYLTDNMENAKDYGKNIIKAYANIKKPFYDNDGKVDISNTKAYKEYESKIIKERAKDEGMTVDEYLEEEGYPDWELEWDNLYNEDGNIEIIKKSLQELGYDGFIGKGSNNIDGLEIVAFSPDQIQKIDNKENEIVEKTDTVQGTEEEVQQVKDEVPSQFIGETPVNPLDNEDGYIRLGKEPTPIENKFTYDSKELEEQYKNNRITKTRKIDKIKTMASEFKKAATRTFRNLDPNLSENAEIMKELVRYPKIKSIAGDEATRILTDITQKENEQLSTEEYSRFERFVLLSDLMEEIELEHTLPGLWTEESVKNNYERLKKSLTPNIEKAFERRTAYWDNLIKDYSTAMGAIGFNVEERFNKKNYFRHQVLEYVNAKNLAGAGNKVKVNSNRGYTKQRQGTNKAINEDYLQAEYEVLATMLYDKEVAQMLKRIDNKYGIKNKLKAQAKEENKRIRESNKTFAMDAINGNKKLEDAYNLLESDRERKDFIKEQAGENYEEPNFTWKDFVPDDYSIWQPIPGKHMFSVNTVSENFAEALINDTLDQLSPSDKKTRKMLAMGLDKEQFVLPNNIATSLDNTYKKITSQDDILHQLLSVPMKLFKSWVLTVNPRQVVKYNIRNITGDIDGLMAAGGFKAFNPKIVGRASKELYNAMKFGRFTNDLLDFRNAGGFSDLMYAQELGEVNEMKKFKIYNKQDTDNIVRKITKSIPGLSTYTNFTENATNYRESIFRYSSYLYFKEDIKKNNGKPTYYGASNRNRIDGLKSIEDKAYQLSKDALGAYDEITEVGQALKKYLIPFQSWNEVNMKRYKRVFENTIKDIKYQKEVGKKVMSGLKLTGFTSVKSAELLGKMAIRVLFASALFMAWNRFAMPDEDDELPDDIKNTPHLTLGKDKDGNIIYFSRLGALNDVLDWFGLDQIQSDFEELLNERKTAKDQLTDMAIAPINKIANSLSPFIKMPLELLPGMTFYPDIRNPGIIRDNGYYIASSLGVKDEYTKLAGLPMETSYLKTWQKAFIYKSKPEVNAYYKALDLKYKFKKQVLKEESNKSLGGKETSEALYYYKQALRYGDEKIAEKYLQKYKDLGGTARGLATSLASLDPLYGLVDKKNEKQQFYMWLTEDERETVKRAIKYYQSLVNQK
jgi:hypothetical protein